MFFFYLYFFNATMSKLKSILNNKWFFPILALYYGVFYILLGETYPFNGGLSTDGYVFSSFIPDFKTSRFFDIYYVHRILPFVFVSVFFKIFSITPSAQSIFTAFQILNVASIVLSCYFFKQILVLFKISLKNQVLAFVLFLLNFGVIKYPFYLPVMTDTIALMLSTALLCFYLKNNITGIVISTLLLAFTWPMGYYQGLLLIAFPLCILPYTQPHEWQKKLIYSASVVCFLIFSVYFVFIKKIDITVDFVMRVDRNLLPLSIFGVALLYFFFSKIFLNKTLLNVPLFVKKINYTRLLISLGAFGAVYSIIHILNPSPTPLYSTIQTLRDPIIYSLIRPFISIVSHVSYFGVVICLLILFWNSFSRTVSQLGWGIVAAFGLNLLLFGITPQSRHLINILPWIIIFLVKAINKYSFSNNFYITVGVLSFIASKVWLFLNIYEPNSTLNVDKNGSIGFPSQILWMNIGPWMNEQMYYIQGAVMLLFIGILFFMLYKIELNGFKKMKFVRKYQILN